MSRKGVYIIRYEQKHGSEIECGCFKNAYLNLQSAQKDMFDDFEKSCQCYDYLGIKHGSIKGSDCCNIYEDNDNYYWWHIEYCKIVED